MDERRSTVPSAIHVIFIGYDDSVFSSEAPSDTRLRHAHYAALLDEKLPGSRLTVLVLTTKPNFRPIRDQQASFIPVTGRNPVKMINLFRTLLSLSRAGLPTVISPQTIFADAGVALSVAKFSGARVVGQIHFDLFSPSVYEEIAPGKMKQALERLKRMTALRVVSQELRRQIINRALHSNVSVIPVPVTMTTAPLMNRAKRVLYVGRLAKEKNLARWLRVATLVQQAEPDVEFEWAGDGPLRSELLEEAARLKLHLKHLGAVPYSQLPAIYSQASVFLLTSDYEGFGRVLVEAALHRLPVVAPQMGGVEDIVVPNETGLLCPQGDESAQADAVLRILRNPTVRDRMGNAARSFVENNFNPQTLAEQWVDLLVSVAKSSK